MLDKSMAMLIPSMETSTPAMDLHALRPNSGNADKNNSDPFAKDDIEHYLYIVFTTQRHQPHHLSCKKTGPRTKCEGLALLLERLPPQTL